MGKERLVRPEVYTYFIAFLYFRVWATSFVNTSYSLLPRPAEKMGRRYHTNESLPFKERVSCSEDSINDMKISCFKLAHHLWNQVGPFVRKIFSTYDTDSITQLKHNKHCTVTLLNCLTS